jgi:hypothetical protein
MKARIATAARSPRRVLPARAAGFVLLAAALCAVPARAAAPEQAPWEKPPTLPTESEFFANRLDEAQSQFITDGLHAFVAGRAFYQALGDINPFLWPGNPFAKLWPDREWIEDSSTVSLEARTGGPAGDPAPEGAPAFSEADVAWQALSELRLHASLNENALYAEKGLPLRRSRAEEGNLSWLGGAFPEQSRFGVGGMWSHRGADIALQYDRGFWWTVSPASGVAYPWKGFNADFLYRVGQDVDITLRDQEWDAASSDPFHSARWRRSDLNMGFTSGDPGGWMTRLELGYQRRALFADSAFEPFEEKTYPVRFRYRNAWAPWDSAVKVMTRGSIGYREQMFVVEHTEEFSEKLGGHEPSQYLRAYYREPVGHRPVPVEYFPGDSVGARTEPGENARGLAAGIEYKYRAGSFQVGAAGDGGLEWSAPLFGLVRIDTVQGLLRRTGAYTGSSYMLANASVRAFAAAAAGPVTCRLHGGLRGFAGHDADAMEFLPSPWWMGADGGWKAPFGLTAGAAVTWLGPKEVRGWGPVFAVPAHWESNVALEEGLLAQRLKLSLSLLQMFGEEVREHPNGSPLGFRVLGRIKGSF